MFSQTHGHALAEVADVAPLPLEHLLPLRVLWVTLRFTGRARLHFFHQPALVAYIRHLLGSPEHFEDLLLLDTPESGRTQYEEGDRYRFAVIALAGGEELLEQLMDALRKAPWLAPDLPAKVPFRNNLRLVLLQDGFTGQQVTDATELCIYDTEQLTQEAHIWSQQPAFEWHWLSPARLLRAKNERGQAKGEARFCRDLATVNAELLLNRVRDALADLLRRRQVTLPARGPAPNSSLNGGHAFWVDAHYMDTQGKSHVMGGLLGHSQWQQSTALPQGWWQILLLGQYIGIGQRRSFGFGRYELVTKDGGVTYRRCSAENSLLARALTMENLQEAYRRSTDALAQQGPYSGEPAPDDTFFAFEDDVEPSHKDSIAIPEDQPWEDPLEYRIDKLTRLREELSNQQYKVPPLTGRQIRKKSGAMRALSVPPFWDRVAQRAVVNVLTPALESLMDDRSYGYRKGRSRMGARDAIQKAWRDGYHWVFEADISDYFTTVSWSRLHDRLRGLYYDDPIVDCLMAWVRAPVILQEKTFQRRSGLPQGSPVSPILANLLLDDFDGDMRNQRFRLIRYADDFVIMCRTQAEANRAQQAAAQSLEEHGLTLHPDKTRVVSAADGFKFLGYLFVNDMALDVGGGSIHSVTSATNEPSNTNDPWQSPAINPALFGLQTAEHTDEQNANNTHLGQRTNYGTLLCVSGETTVVSLRQGRLIATRNDTELFNSPMHGVQALLLLGSHHITTPALRAALKADIPVHFANSQGYYEGVSWSGSPATTGHTLWLRQQQLAGNVQTSIAVASALVHARILQQAELLRQRGSDEWVRVKESAHNLNKVTSLESLNGIEGSAARLFFSGLKSLLPKEWGFDGRNRRPPRDPFNVLLSLGYTLLYAHSDTLLRTAGLLPWQGFYHQTRGRHAALASDLMEPFRHIVERVALNQISLRQITLDDFILSEGGKCEIKTAAKKRYIAALLKRFYQPRTQNSELCQLLHQQAHSLTEWIYGKQPFEVYSPRAQTAPVPPLTKT